MTGFEQSFLVSEAQEIRGLVGTNPYGVPITDIRGAFCYWAQVCGNWYEHSPDQIKFIKKELGL